MTVLALVFIHSPAQAQDALRGKRLYLDGGRMNGSGLSCVDCHGGLPGALHGIAKAANNPSAIHYALGMVGPIAPLRGRLDDRDIADLAAYLGFADVPSPQPQLRVSDAAGKAAARERMELNRAASVGELMLSNAGALPLRLLSGPLLSGSVDSRFYIDASDCREGMILASGDACRIRIGFHPDAAATVHTAILSLRHDWVGEGLHLALIGRP